MDKGRLVDDCVDGLEVILPFRQGVCSISVVLSDLTAS